MSDEKTTIYISPEDDLTSLRERLEKIPARSVTLVIPTQSQLRSHVAWKLLRARTRELGKEILVVSTDPHIREVAHKLEFRVANSLESSSSGKSRPSNRSDRSALGNRNRPSGSIQRPAPARNAAPDSMLTPQPDPMEQWSPSTDRSIQSPEPEDNRLADGVVTGNISDIDPSVFEDDRYNAPGEQPPYDFQVNQSPSIHPLSQQQIDEEPDLWIEDFNQAQDIREAWSQKGRDEPPLSSGPVDHDAYVDHSGGMTTPTQSSPLEEARHDYRMTPLPGLGEDPHAYMDDDFYPPLPEQHASAPAIEGFGTNEHAIQDVSAMPDEIRHDIEYEGGQDNFAIRSDTPPAPQPLSDPLAEDDQDRAGPSRIYRIRPRSNRSGRQPVVPPVPPASPNRPRQDFDNDDALPPIADRPTHVTPQPPPATPAASGTFTTPRRNLQPGSQSRASGNLPPNQAPRMSGGLSPSPVSRASGNLQPGPATRSSGNMQTGPTPRSSRDQQPRQAPASTRGNTSSRNRPAGPLPVPRKVRTDVASARLGPQARATVRSAAQRRRSIGLLVLVAVVLLLIVLGLAAYLLPSAEVTVTLAAQNYSAPVKLLAAPTNSSNAAAGTIQDETLKKDFTINGTGKATGSTKVGTAPAKGIVFFTNNGSQQVIIPSNVIVTTSNGTQFVTQAEVSVGPKGSSLNRLPTTIQAQSAGDTGNVPAGNITSIPQSSLSAIAQYNNTQVSSLNLKVTNDAATSGGGAGTATSVTQDDLNNTQTALSAQLQGEVSTWMKQQLSPADVAGKPVTTPTLTKAPKVNDIEQSGTFPASLTQSVELPVVRSATLESATIVQLNTSLSKNARYQNYQIIADQPNAVQIPQFTPTSNGLFMTLSFTPTGKIIPKIPDVRSRLVGKTTSDVTSTLKEIIPGVQKVDLKVSPGIDPWTPLRTDQINVRYVAGSSLPSNVKLAAGS